MNLLESVHRAISVVRDGGLEGVLIGGLAVSARAEPRFTRDADLAVSVASDAQAEALLRAFMRSGYALQVVLEQSGVGRLSGARLIDPDGVEVDLLTASSGIEPEIVVDADELEIVRGFRVPVAATGHLIALKLLSVSPGRETDAMDLQALSRVADEIEWARAEVAVALIAQRGFHRGRDLAADLTVLRGRSVT